MNKAFKCHDKKKYYFIRLYVVNLLPSLFQVSNIPIFLCIVSSRSLRKLFAHFPLSCKSQTSNYLNIKRKLTFVSMNIKMPTFYLFPSLCKLLFTVVQLKPQRHMYAIIFPKRFYLQNFTAFYSYGVIGANLGNCDFKKSLTGTYDSIISGYCELSIQPIKV